MKKIILIASLLLAFTGISFAQTTPAKKDAPKTAAAAPTKKDGTADMRYKANKDAAKAKAATPPVHVKKDGTADKRFKENKDKKSGK
jgi:hypothetical protein